VIVVGLIIVAGLFFAQRDRSEDRWPWQERAA
jgi:hypothetical protein